MSDYHLPHCPDCGAVNAARLHGFYNVSTGYAVCDGCGALELRLTASSMRVAAYRLRTNGGNEWRHVARRVGAMLAESERIGGAS